MSNWKNWVIFKPVFDFYNSFFNNDQGFSFRKLYASIALIFAYQLQTSILDDHVKQQVIYAWMMLGAVCIGLVTIPDLIKFLNKKDDEPKS